MNVCETKQQERAWAVHQWMQRNQDIEWCNQVGQIWLSNLWSTYNETTANCCNSNRYLDWLKRS